MSSPGHLVHLMYFYCNYNVHIKLSGLSSIIEGLLFGNIIEFNFRIDNFNLALAEVIICSRRIYMMIL